jgi:2-oxoglutarate ferredoxin oxidoreductase subunit delta
MATGTVQIDVQHCKGCGLCIAACPAQVLQFSTQLNAQGYHIVELSSREAHDGRAGTGGCTGCALCALVCPDLVFTVYREPVVHARRGKQAVAAIQQEVTHERALEG